MKCLIIIPLAFLASSSDCGYKKEEFLAIQRDVARIDAEVRAMQSNLDSESDKMAQIAQQISERANRISQELDSMERDVLDAQRSRRQRIGEPVTAVNQRVDDIIGDLRTARNDFASLSARVNALQDEISRIQNNLRRVPPPPLPDPGSAR